MFIIFDNVFPHSLVHIIRVETFKVSFQSNSLSELKITSKALLIKTKFPSIRSLSYL